MDAERSRFIGSRGHYAAALRVSADDYRLSLQLRVKHLLHRNEEGIQINMEDTASHETVYKLAHRADKTNFPLACDYLTLYYVLDTAQKTIDYFLDSSIIASTKIV
jgi:hypothetical protein